MNRSVRKHLTYANVMATLGVFIALGGGAYAVATKAPKDSVTSKSIVDDSVKSADVKDNSLTGTDIDQSTLSGGGGGGGPPSGPAGGDLAGNYPKPQIAPGAVDGNKLADGAAVQNIGAGTIGSGKLGDIRVVSNATFLDQNPTGLVQKCPSGTRLIGGGTSVSPNGSVVSSNPDVDATGTGQGVNADTWEGSGKLNAGENFGSMRVYALCLE